MKPWQSILILIAFCGAGVFLLLIFLGYVLAIPEKQVTPSTASPVLPTITAPIIDPARDTIIGRATAPVTIVAYMDFGCTHCKVVNDHVRTLFEQFPNTIRLVWKDVPRVTQQGSVDAHIAVRCAYEQNKFEVFRDLVYNNQPNFSSSSLRMSATTLGLNLPRFTACQERQDHLARFDVIREEVAALGLTGTPTLFINDKRVEGEVSFETLKTIVENEQKILKRN